MAVAAAAGRRRRWRQEVLSMVTVAGHERDSLQSYRIGVCNLTVDLLDSSNQPSSALAAVIFAGSEEEDGLFLGFDFLALYALMDEEDDGIWIILSSPSFLVAWIYKPDADGGARHRQPLMKTMEHRIWCSGGAPKFVYMRCTFCNLVLQLIM
ncbi:hypothetical protein ACLOJK_024034 [Asimina triloba]